jgi:outer membrane protein assembly factor BamB
VSVARGSYVFSPAIVGDSVYAGARDGTLDALRWRAADAWRVAAGQIISGGVGSDGKLVVVGSPKGRSACL